MVVVNKRAVSLGGFSQERLAKEDLRLLIDIFQRLEVVNDRTRIELLIGKLKRMLK